VAWEISPLGSGGTPRAGTIALGADGTFAATISTAGLRAVDDEAFSGALLSGLATAVWGLSFLAMIALLWLLIIQRNNFFSIIALKTEDWLCARLRSKV
jgi:hypothetical protein